jgi:DNA-binding NarL/FixJ family response regulator
MMTLSKHFSIDKSSGGLMQFNQKIRIHFMHADPVVSAGLRAILSSSSELNLSVHDSLAELQSAVIIADYHSGLHFYQHMPRASHQDGFRVLIVTHYEKEGEVRHAVECGVHGYLLQSCVPEELANAVHMLSSGQRYLSDNLKRSIADSLGRTGLTGRESDVLQLLGKGYCNKLIARDLGIGLSTVKCHVKGVMAKLNATARTHAVVVATQRGLIRADAGTASYREHAYRHQLPG